MNKEIYVIVDNDFLTGDSEAICAFTSFAEAEKYVHHLFTELWDNVIPKEEEVVTANEEKNFYYNLESNWTHLTYAGFVKISAIPLKETN